VRENEHEAERRTSTVLFNRRFLTCPECGWVHYVMTAEEKATNDRSREHLIARYHLSEKEQLMYESAFQQCLRCESPARVFRAATERDLDRAANHIVTPVYVEPDVGTQ
jgi:predicted  nucleic acid-binding Zn-ribbon protein